MKHLACLLLITITTSAIAAQHDPKLRFVPDGKGFRFDTGILRGELHKDGKSLGLTNVLHLPTQQPIAAAYGLLSHYRLLDAANRYGPAAWDWNSNAKLLDDGAVEVNWTADHLHPFHLKAVYRWLHPNQLQVLTEVTPTKNLKHFEVFLASYFAGFEQSFLLGNTGLVEALKTDGDWQAWVRDDSAAKLLNDGRWKREPHPVDWVIRGAFQKPLAIRKDSKTGLIAIIASQKDHCFAVLTPYGQEGHRSLYLSLFGVDLQPDQKQHATATLTITTDANQVSTTPPDPKPAETHNK